MMRMMMKREMGVLQPNAVCNYRVNKCCIIVVIEDLNVKVGNDNPNREEILGKYGN